MIIMYTDGSAKANGSTNNRGGWGLVITRDGVLLETAAERCFNTTNNREEMKAVLKALELIQTKYKDEKCVIYSDSTYVVNIWNNWMSKWASNNWINSKGKIIENLDLVKSLYKYFNTDFLSCQVDIKKCKGHSNIPGNNLADALATNQLDKIEKLKKQMS